MPILSVYMCRHCIAYQSPQIYLVPLIGKSITHTSSVATGIIAAPSHPLCNIVPLTDWTWTPYTCRCVCALIIASHTCMYSAALISLKKAGTAQHMATITLGLTPCSEVTELRQQPLLASKVQWPPPHWPHIGSGSLGHGST